MNRCAYFAVVIVTLLLTQNFQAEAQDIFVTDFSNDIVRRYDRNSGAFLGNFSLFAGNGGLDAPRGITFGTNGNIFVNSTGSGRRNVIEFNAGTGSSLGNFVPGAYLGDSYLAPDGNFYMTGVAASHTRIYRYNATTGVGGLITNRLNNGGASGVTMGPDGNLYIATFNSNRIEKYSPTGAFIKTIASNVGSNSLGGITFGPDGNLYVTGDLDGNVFTGGRVFKYNPVSGRLLDTLGANATNFSSPTDIEFGTDGNLYVLVNGGVRKIVRMNALTGSTTDLVAQGSGGLAFPFYFAMNPGKVFTTSQEVGNGSRLRMNVAEVQAAVDGIVEATDLGTTHGLEAIAAGSAVSKANSISREFMVNEGGVGQTDVYLNAIFDGALRSSDGGTASVSAKISILDESGDVVEELVRSFEVNSRAGMEDNLAIDSKFFLSALLTEGQLYELKTEFEVFADNTLGGTAGAFFNDTFSVSFGPVGVPEPGAFILLVMSSLVVAARRRRIG